MRLDAARPTEQPQDTLARLRRGSPGGRGGLGRIRDAQAVEPLIAALPMRRRS